MNRRIQLKHAVATTAALTTLALCGPVAWPQALAAKVDAGPSVEASVSPYGANLGFSGDGRMLHVVGSNVADLAREQHVRATTYDAVTGAVVHMSDLQPDTSVLAITPDGETAIVAEGDTRLVRLDSETGQLQDIPPAWYNPQEIGGESIAGLSGSGRLVSIYSSSRESGMIVSVYDWPTKALLARQTSQGISVGGIDGGDVTSDGAAIEFTNNRVGRKVVDLKTGRLMAWFAFSSVRSPDGAWVVEFPDLSFDESKPKAVVVKDGRTGQIRGKLDVQVSGDELYGNMSGAFCGTTGRFVLARWLGAQSVAMYAIPSGATLASFPAATWRDAKAEKDDPVHVACSSTGQRTAILSGTRLTFHDLR